MENVIREELTAFMSRTGGQAQAALLVRRDGLPVAYVAPGLDVKLISALTALALGSLKRMGEELKLGASKNVFVYFENKLMLLWPVKDLYIVVIAGIDANLGLLMLELERLGRRLSEAL
ncbi:MAG: roadblock/LC7 domain-containing protein [Pyrobaculum sp.]